MRKTAQAATATVLALACLATALTAAPAAAAAPGVPELVFTGPSELAGEVDRLERFDPESLRPVMALVGLTDPGPPIHVAVAPEGSPEARRSPSWGIAYAIGAIGQVVMIPSRIPEGGAVAYPDGNLETVLRHELAHVLIARAARRRPVPRWLDEGVAIYAARDWGMSDRTRLAWATMRRGNVALADLDDRFYAGAAQAERAYTLAAAFVRFLVDEHGPRAVAQILRGLGEGLPFPAAFERATGDTLAGFEERFWQHLDLWSKWVPILTSSTTLWALVTALALLAFKRRRERDAEQRTAWEQEEALRAAAAAAAIEDGERAGHGERSRTPSGSWIH